MELTTLAPGPFAAQCARPTRHALASQLRSKLNRFSPRTTPNPCLAFAVFFIDNHSSYSCAPFQNETDTMSQPTRLTVAGWKQCSFFVKAANVAASLEHLFPSRIKVRGRSRRPPSGFVVHVFAVALVPFRAPLPPRTSECLAQTC